MILRLSLAVCFALLVACSKPVPSIVPNEVRTPQSNLKVVLQINGERELTQLPSKVYYGIENIQQCIPLDMTKAIGGIRPFKSIPKIVHPVKAEKSRFETLFPERVFQDEDYYGLGVCKWREESLEISISDGVQIYSYPMSLVGARTRVARFWCYRGGGCLNRPSPNPRANPIFDATLTMERAR